MRFCAVCTGGVSYETVDGAEGRQHAETLDVESREGAGDGIPDVLSVAESPGGAAIASSNKVLEMMTRSAAARSQEALKEMLTATWRAVTM